jgi:hypothetical protein
MLRLSIRTLVVLPFQKHDFQIKFENGKKKKY